MFYDYILKAGLGWMLPILILSWIGMAFSLERAVFWIRQFRRRRRRRSLLRRILGEPFEKDRVLAELGKTGDVTLSPHYVLFHNHGRVDLDIAEQRSRDRADEVLRESRQWGGLLTFIANLSGTLGLMGTVAGVSMSFEDIALQNPKGLALSLATAMYTTLGGIFLFLVTFFFATIYASFADRLEDRLDREINRFREFLALQPERREPAAEPEAEPDIAAEAGSAA